MSTSAPARPRRRLALAACAGALALGLAACGSSGDSDPDPGEAVPASAPIYAEITVRPDGDLKADTEQVAQQLLGTKDIVGELDKAMASSGDPDQTSLAKDFAPWVGSRVGIFANGFSGDSFDGAAVFSIADKDKAQSTLESEEKGNPRRSYQDVDYYVDDDSVTGIVDEYLVSGSERGFKAVVDTVKGDDVETIEDSDKYEQALDALGSTDASLATVYVAPKGLLDALGRSGGVPPQVLSSVREQITQAGGESAAAKLDVSSDAIAVESVSLGVPESATAAETGDATAALQALPGDAWVGVGIGALGPQLDNALDQLLQTAQLAGQDVQAQLDAIQRQLGIDLRGDLLSWMGDASLFARGTAVTSIGGALIVQSSDPAKSKVALTKLVKLVRSTSPSTKVTPLNGVSGVDAGVQVSDPGLPMPILAAVGGDKFVIAIGRQALEAALSPSTTLADNAAYKQATAALSGVDPSLFVDFAPIVSLVKGLGAENDPSGAQAVKVLSRLGALAAGGKRDGTTARGKLVLTLPQ